MFTLWYVNMQQVYFLIDTAIHISAVYVVVHLSLPLLQPIGGRGWGIWVA